MSSKSSPSRRLLVRDLEQVVTPAGSGAPLRGTDLGRIDIVQRGYVLCEDGHIAEVGRMSELDPVGADVEELDGRGLCALPGLVDCHTHACFAGDRAHEFELRSRGASYEELHAAGGGILSTVEATRAAGEERSSRPGAPPPRVDAARGHDDVRGEIGVRARPRDRARVAAGDRRRGRGPDLAGRSCRPARVRRRRCVPRLRARRGAPRGRGNRGSGGCLPGAWRLHGRAGAALPRRVPTRRGWRCGSTATSSRSRARSRSQSSSAPDPSTTSRRPATTACARSPRATSSA